MKTTMPKMIFVYPCDWKDGKPIWAVVEKIEDIPEDMDGQSIGQYLLELARRKLRVRKDVI
jgi:hypothetical protein